MESDGLLRNSVVEGVLFEMVLNRPEQAGRCPAAPRDRPTGKPKPFAQWSLTQMINVAHQCGWIGSDVKDWSIVLRDYRNMVHPREELKAGDPVDDDTVSLCWDTVAAALNDLASVQESGSAADSGRAAADPGG